VSVCVLSRTTNRCANREALSDKWRIEMWRVCRPCERSPDKTFGRALRKQAVCTRIGIAASVAPERICWVDALIRTAQQMANGPVPAALEPWCRSALQVLVERHRWS
jgi:hypothetical protein